MSVGDYVRYLRALKGGPALWEVSSASGVRTDLLRQIEQRYSEVSDDDSITRIAAYYGVEPDELSRRRPWFRKLLSGALEHSLVHRQPIQLTLRTGDQLTGQVKWWDLGAALLDLGNDQELVIQRHIVERWEIPGELEAPDEEASLPLNEP